MDKLTSLVLRHKISTIPNNITNANPSFLGLPGEIRNLIYTFLFANIDHEVALPITRPKRKLTDKLKRKVLASRGARVPHLALLMTCRQIRAEAFAYEHGSIPAMFAMGDSYTELARQILTGSLKQELKKALRAVGEDLPFVTHLEIHGADTLRSLTHKQRDEEELARRRKSHNFAVRRGAKLSDKLADVRRHLPNVRCITVTDKIFDVVSYFEPDVWCMFMLVLRMEPGRFKAVFPLVTEIRLQGSQMGRRYRKCGCGKWSEWYGGAPMQLPF